MPYTKAFNKLFKSMKEEYLGKPVPKKYQYRYGEKYDKLSEIKAFAYATAKKRRIPIDKQ